MKDKFLQKIPELEAHTKSRDVLMMFEKRYRTSYRVYVFTCDYKYIMYMTTTANMIHSKLASKKIIFYRFMVSEDILAHLAYCKCLINHIA